MGARCSARVPCPHSLLRVFWCVEMKRGLRSEERYQAEGGTCCVLRVLPRPKSVVTPCRALRTNWLRENPKEGSGEYRAGRRDSRRPVPQIRDESQFAGHLKAANGDDAAGPSGRGRGRTGTGTSSSNTTALPSTTHKLANKRNPRETKASKDNPKAISSVRVRFRETHRSQSRKVCGDLNLHSDTDARYV